MESKKSAEADLERKRAGFFALGLVIASSTIWLSLSFRSAEDNTEEKKIVFEASDREDILEIEEMQEEPPPPEEPEIVPPPPQAVEDIIEVEDDVEVDTDLGLDIEIEEIPDDTPVEIEEEPIVDFAEVDPMFPGGEAEMNKFIQENVEYPQMSIEMGEQGIVYVEFVVNKNGSIEQVKVVRGVSDALDAEAKRVVKTMPRWTPGEQAGKPVRVRFTIPIHFRLG
ncbi:MAG: energy transducer TonB [Crocinitomicaceae bacterium]|nr:energy transducer TonB [Crocinitomicaceae bacterium]